MINGLQGSDVGEAPAHSARSPLSERLTGVDPFPKSPLGFNSNSYMSTHILPPLKFHSGLLTPHSIVAPPLGKGDDDDWGSDEESVASVPDDMDCSYTDEEDDSLKPVLHRYDEEEVFGHMPHTRVKSGTGRPLNRGLAMEKLKIEVPRTSRRHTADGGLGMRTCAPSGLTSAPASSRMLRERVLLRNVGVR